MKKAKIIVLLILFVSALNLYNTFANSYEGQNDDTWINVSNYQSEVEDSKTTKSRNFLLNEDVTIEGVFGMHTFFVDIDKHWEIINNSYLELIFSQSQIKDYKNSTLTIEVNNSPIYSVLLYDKGVNRERVRVPIPLDKINQGFNEVKLKVYHRVTDEPCTDIINPGNWIVFHKDSFVHIEFTEIEDKLSIKDYPYPYLKANSDNPINSLIVIPDVFRSHELNAAMILAANFGQRFPYSKLDINISRFSEATSKNMSNIIYVGGIDNAPKEILSSLTNEEMNMASNMALIKEVKSPYNSKYNVLLILSNNEESIIKAVKALANDNLVSQMDKSYQYISDNLSIQEENLLESDYIFLEDLGYSNIKLEGLFYQRATFGVNIPKNWIIKDGSLLHIDMRYSEVLNFERSVITVYINDVPIGSKELSLENADNDFLEIEIPSDIRDNNYYNIKIVFYLELKGQDCNYIRDSNSWAYVSNKSYLYLPHERRKDSFFENYENPFIVNNKFNNITILVPKDLNSYEMGIVGNIVGALGRNVNSLENIEVKTENRLSNELNDKNLIIIGTPSKNNLIKDLNNKLHIKFSNDFSKLISNEKMTLLDDYNRNLATLQLIESPLNVRNSALIVTATKSEGLQWAKEFLTDFELVTRLRGNAVVIDEAGNIQGQYYGIQDNEEQNNIVMDKENKKEIKKIILNKQIRNYIIFIIAILTFIIVSSILIIRKRR